MGAKIGRDSAAKKTIARWLNEKALPADEVTLVNTSGDVYWSDRVASGRADLLAALGSIEGRKPRRSRDMTEEEADRIAEGGLGATMTEARIVERALREGACVSSRECLALVHARAAELHERSAVGARAVFRTVEQLSAGLASRRGRKSIVVFSEGLPRDTSVGGAESAIRASQRGNTAVYLVDARGIVSASLYDAEDDTTPGPHYVGPLALDEGLVPGAMGGERLAEATGGSTVRNTNDLAAGLEKVMAESSAYYLLGYQPERAPDGSWRKLKVKVRGRGLKVRARVGYYAAPTVAKAPTEEPPSKKGFLSASFAAGGDRNQISVRLAAQPMGRGDGDRVRVLVGSEIDRGNLTFTTTGTSSAATVELTLAAVCRDRPGIVVLEDRAQVPAVPEGEVPWPYTREVSLPPGVSQLRLQVKDVASGRVGTVRARVEVRPGQTASLGADGEGEATPDAADRTGFLTRDLPLLAALEAGMVKSAFEHRAALVPLEPTSGERGARLVVDVPREAIDLQPDAKGSVYRGLLEVAAFVTDEEGRLLARVRRNWPLEAPAENGLLMPGGDWSFEQVLGVAPGHLTLTSAVRDPGAGRTSVSRRMVELAAPSLGPALASLGSPAPNAPGLAIPALPQPSHALPPVDPSLAALLEKAAAYVVGYDQAFRDVVAEETYTQWTGSTRQLSRSDLVYVSIPGPIAWTCFRDVFEVDGLPVRDRQSRVEKLFLSGSRTSALQKANAIIKESARYNLGQGRTINVPTLPLLFLHPYNQKRFRFERKGRRRFGDRESVEVAFREIARPSLVNNGAGVGVPASGRIFIDAKDGTVLRTEVTFRPGNGAAHLAADYQFDKGLGLWLPAAMKEDYDPVTVGFGTEGTARYAKYRRFNVTTEETVANPSK